MALCLATSKTGTGTMTQFLNVIGCLTRTKTSLILLLTLQNRNRLNESVGNTSQIWNSPAHTLGDKPWEATQLRKSVAKGCQQGTK